MSTVTSVEAAQRPFGSVGSGLFDCSISRANDSLRVRAEDASAACSGVDQPDPENRKFVHDDPILEGEQHEEQTSSLVTVLDALRQVPERLQGG